MKIKIIIIACLGMLFSIACKAQKISLNDKISIVLSANTKKMTGASAEGFAKSKNIKLTALPEGENKTIFVSDDIIVSLMAFKTNERVDLEKLKKTMDAMAEDTKTYSSRISSINGNRFLIVEDKLITKLTFFSTNAINGIINFNEKDRAKALQVLQKTLESISFQ